MAVVMGVLHQEICTWRNTEDTASSGEARGDDRALTLLAVKMRGISAWI